MLLTIDVGNTNTVVGVFARGAAERAPLLHWRVSTDRRRTSDEWLVLLRAFLLDAQISLHELHGIVIASVVPRVTSHLIALCEQVDIAPLLLNHETDTGMQIDLENPSETGADRIANGVAARALFGSPCVVVDMGTATTFDVVNNDGAYVGGVILPGLEISLDALVQHASALRNVDIAVPSAAIGHSTRAAVQSGITIGAAVQIDGLITRIKEELRSGERDDVQGDLRGAGTKHIHVIATGGLSKVIAPLLTQLDSHEPWLTLQGLALVYERMNAS